MNYESSRPSAPRVSVLLGLCLLALLAVMPLVPARGQSLLGSRESMLRQSMVAQQNDYAYLRTSSEVWKAIEAGTLVRVPGNEDYELAIDEVSFPCARPQVKMFIEQLAREYRSQCGERLVITSLTRPITRQPWNASPLSVHPTGMAIDMRRSDRRLCRLWLETTLLSLEAGGMIEATRELWPAHYHVAVFPDPALLLGPIGDPYGVVKLAALHRNDVPDSEIALARSSVRAGGGRAHVRVARGRNGRLHITQAIARHGARGGNKITIRRHSAGRRAAGRTHRGHRGQTVHAKPSQTVRAR